MMEDYGETLADHSVDGDDFFTLDSFIEDVDGDGDDVGLDDPQGCEVFCGDAAPPQQEQ
jgi:hypothetical protein